MGMAANPILSDSPAPLRFSEHARFSMEERAVDQGLIQDLVTSPKADFKIDAKSGNYVFRSEDYRIVVKKGDDGSFMVLSIINRDQLPT
jgi:hypothetical protein